MDDSQYRSRLERERAETAAELKRMGADVASIRDARLDANSDDEHDPEGSTIAFEQSQVATLIEQSRERLEQIDAAFVRLDEGTYGRCIVCTAPIPQGRLDALPWTPYCIEHTR